MAAWRPACGCRPRVLARTLGIARNTVVHVYEQLTFEGYVQARVGRGTFVADVFPRPVVAAGKFPLDRNAPLSRRGERTVREALAARLQWGAFAPGVPELRMFPIQTWNRLQARVWRRVEPERLSYATGHGDAGLREAIADYLRGTRGIACTPAQVVITSGTQQSLHLVAQLLADPGDRVWLEDPGYWGARSSFMPPAWRAWRWRSTARAWRQAPRNGPSRRGWCSCRRRTNIPPART